MDEPIAEELSQEEIDRALEEIEAEEAEELDEIGLLSEEIAVSSIENEERHEEILECLHRLENSSTETENPVNQAMLTELSTLKAEITELKGMLIALQTSLTALSHGVRPAHQPSESETPNPTPEMENPSSEPNQERSTAEPAPEEMPKRKRRIL